MGSISETGEFKKSLVPMPWSARVMGQAPVTSTMFQRIALEGAAVDDAYKTAVEAFKTEMEAWKAENKWEAPDPNWQPPGMQ